jgi:hypothetical protein
LKLFLFLLVLIAMMVVLVDSWSGDCMVGGVGFVCRRRR